MRQPNPWTNLLDLLCSAIFVQQIQYSNDADNSDDMTDYMTAMKIRIKGYAATEASRFSESFHYSEFQHISAYCNKRGHRI